MAKPPRYAKAPKTTALYEQKLGDTNLIFSDESQKAILGFVTSTLAIHKQMNDMQAKMDAIDEAYYRFKIAVSGGVDVVHADGGCESCGDVLAGDEVTPPIVVAQVDSYVGYLADVFLSGSPLFPVVSSPANRKWAEQLETLIDDHAQIGGYTRQLLLFIHNAVKYNYGAIEAEWTGINQFSISPDVTAPNGKKTSKGQKKYTRILALDMRNTLRDPACNPGDIAEEGDYAGKIEVLSKMKLLRKMEKLKADGKLFNKQKAIQSGGTIANPTALTNYTEPPLLSKYINARKRGAMGPEAMWADYFGDSNASSHRVAYGTQYEVVTVYARICPCDFGIKVPEASNVQIWKFIVVNGQALISAERIISAYDFLPILFGQPMEDMMGDQTQGVAEGEIDFQEGAKTLFAIRFAAARRAVSDRALYLEEMIDPKHVNSKAAAPKIPVRISVLSTKTLEQAYKQIPFDMRGTETVLQDAQQMVQFSKELHGLNNARQGMATKGNKSVQEWNDTMGGSENRLRLPALRLEVQAFGPLKSIICLNLFQYGDSAIVISQKSGREMKIDIAKLREKVMAFKVADGYTPKSRLAATEAITAGMTLIGNSPILQQQYGPSLPEMFAHMMSLMGVKDLEEYNPAFKATMDSEDGKLPPAFANLMQNSLQPMTPPGAGGAAQMPPPMQMPPQAESLTQPLGAASLA